MKLGLNRASFALIAFMLIGGYFLWTEHAAHIAIAIPYLPFLLFLACPLLHLFMHGGHGHGGHGHGGHGHGGHGHKNSERDRQGQGPTGDDDTLLIDKPVGKSRLPTAGGHHD